ncbi:class I SAM-dependent RNA methyltransferase [Rhodobacterales bacterium HKCCE2091]|nr:class I SAM-dependent RNA methyltransferase [Rhodobacterales bacterium HKCCE2091]
MSDPISIFLVATPGLERLVAEEAAGAGFGGVTVVPGGVEVAGGWPEVRRANRELRGPVRVLARVAEFRAMHPAQLDKRARKLTWRDWLRGDVPVSVEAVCRKSRIYHAGAAKGRVAGAIAAAGVPVAEKAEVAVKARIEDDLCTVSLDTSGEPLHRRGHKEWVGKAPMRENMAAMFLRACGFDGSGPVVDPMCGSGTFVIEAAEIAAGLMPGRSRDFAFTKLAVPVADEVPVQPPVAGAARFFGYDRDAGAARGAAENAERAGVAALCRFDCRPVSDLAPPEGPPGLVIVNPPYGARIGNRKLLFGLYGALGGVLRERFPGWRVGLVTSDGGLAQATGLDWSDTLGPVDLGGTKIALRQAVIG